MNEPRVKWGNDGFAAISGWATVYRTAQPTGEYLSSDQEWVVIGTGLSAGAYLDAPPQPVPGYAIVRSAAGWEVVEDHRGYEAYEKLTRQPLVIEQFGPIPDHLTLIAPMSDFDVWDEMAGAWVKDTAAEQAWLVEQATYQRQALMSEASQEIAALVDALDPSIINDPSDDDQVKLVAWKTYRVELYKIDQQPFYPTAINWPVKP